MRPKSDLPDDASQNSELIIHGSVFTDNDIVNTVGFDCIRVSIDAFPIEGIEGEMQAELTELSLILARRCMKEVMKQLAYKKFSTINIKRWSSKELKLKSSDRYRPWVNSPGAYYDEDE